MRFELTIPPNTPVGAPVSQTFQYTGNLNGHIMGYVVRIPKGHAYLAGLQMYAGRKGRVIPALGSGVEWMRGDGDTIISSDIIELEPPQYAVELRGYNLDDTFSHTFYLDLA